MSSLIADLVAPDDPAVSPDGAVAFVVTAIDLEGDRYRRQIWIAGDGRPPRPFTTGEDDRSPRWSPDGASLAFLRSVADCPQLAVIPVNGGEARVVTELDLGVLSPPVWSPDGGLLAFIGGVWEEGWDGLDDEERGRRPRHITRRLYRHDLYGWVHDRRRYVHVVAPDGGSARRVTEGREDEAAPALSPDGARVAFLSDTTERPGFSYGFEVFEASIDGGEVRQVGERGDWAALAYREDGELFALGSPGPSFPEPGRLWHLTDPPRCLSEKLDRATYALAGSPPRLVFEGEVAVVSVVDAGSIGVVEIDPGGAIRDRIRHRSVVTGFDAVGGVLAATISTVTSPGRLRIEGPEGVAEHEDFGGPEVPAVEPLHLEVGSLDVWVYLPPGNEMVPLLLNIHGGPASQFGWGFFDEFQVYARAGYGVVATNPRGSTGGDREFLRAVVGAGWGKVDVEDIDAVVGAALSQVPRLDGRRMGVMGGSYGGFLTAWLIAHQERWSTAIVERALLSWPSFGGTSDIGGWFSQAYLGDRQLEWDRSPLRLADRVKTPTLVLHSEQDWRCPISQAEEYFNALLASGVHAEFVRFPGEGHELTRTGSPRHRQERFDIILDWLARTL